MYRYQNSTRFFLLVEILLEKMLLVLPVCCQHDLAIQSVSAPPCAMGREAGRRNQQCAGSRAAPRGGRRVLSIADNPEAVSCHIASIAAGFTIQNKNLASYWSIPILPIRLTLEGRDYFSHTASMSQRHRRRIGSHPRITNSSVHRQLQRNGDDNGGPPGRYRAARCGNPKLNKVSRSQKSEGFSRTLLHA